MIRIHEAHTQDIVPGTTYKEQNNLSVVDALVALTAHLRDKFVVHEARYKRLVLKVGSLGPSSLVTFTGPVEDVKALLQATFVYSVFQDNMRSQEVLRGVIEDRDAFQEHLLDLNDAGTDWRVLALGVPLGMTDVQEMKALYDERLAYQPIVEEEPSPASKPTAEDEPSPAAKPSAFVCEEVDPS